MDAREFENIFIDYLICAISKKGLNKSDIAREAFGESEDMIRKWQQLRTQNKEKRQRVRLGEAYNLCKAMGLSLSYVCNMIENGDAQQIIAITPIEEAKPGRKRKKKQAAIPMEQLAFSDNEKTINEGDAGQGE